MFQKLLSLATLLTVSFPSGASADHVPCQNIVDIACSTDDFSTLCDAVKAADLGAALSKGSWTVFAPTNDAFSKLGDTLDVVLSDKNLLTDVLLFHAVDDVVSSEDLACSGRVEMANGQDSRTVCQGAKVFQKGGSNPRNNMPQIVSVDIATCQGFIHVVDEVMLPGRLPAPSQPPPPACKSIADIACSLPDFSTLCTAVKTAGLAEALSEGKWTVFAPTNEAFKKLGDVLDAVLADVDLLKNVLLFHAVDKILFAADLECTHTITMVNGDRSRTVCMGDNVYQKGGSNPRSDMPKIIDADVGACNGVIHAIDEVMLS